MGDLSAQRRFQTSLLTAFALVAVLLAAIGVYGIVHYAVAEQWRELGVRAALGAAPGDLFRDVVRRGMTFPVVGLAIGLALAAGTSRLLTRLLFGIGRSDPVTIATTVGVLGAVALVACYLPARRAARVDPIIALRSE
jgi:putative ABC transport system permease protein